MALPTTIVTAILRAGHHPPFKSSGGNFYGILPRATDDIAAWKATDPTDSFTETDAANGPTNFATIQVFGVAQLGDELHIAIAQGSTYRYNVFDMSSDTWTTTDETIEAPTNAPTFPWISIAVRSDGDVIVVYAGDTDQVMGGTKERVDVNVRTGGTWGGSVVLSGNDTADEHWGNPNCVKASDSDDIHIVWSRTTVTADPPTGWQTTEARTIDSGDSLSNIDIDAVDTGSAVLGMQNGVAFDSGGTQLIRFVGANPLTGEVFMLDDAGTGGKTSQFESPAAVEYADTLNDPRNNGEVSICTIAGPDANGDLHILWPSDHDTNDIYYVTSTDNGDTWSTEAQELDAVAVNWLSANIYVRGIDTVLAYVYDDGGVTKYNEKVIIEGVAGDPQPMIIRGTNVPHVRQWHPRGLRR